MIAPWLFRVALAVGLGTSGGGACRPLRLVAGRPVAAAAAARPPPEDGTHRGRRRDAARAGLVHLLAQSGRGRRSAGLRFLRLRNVAAVEVLYPAPVRHDDGASVSLIYRDEVVFPLVGDAARARRAGHAARRARASACAARSAFRRRRASEVAPLPPEPDPLTDARLAPFQARVPRRAEARALRHRDGDGGRRRAARSTCACPNSSYLRPLRRSAGRLVYRPAGIPVARADGSPATGSRSPARPDAAIAQRTDVPLRRRRRRRGDRGEPSKFR